MSRPIPKFAGTITKGDLIIADPKRFKMYCCGFKDGSPVEVVVKRPTKERSNQQNAYYWGVVIHLIHESTGEDPDRIHGFLSAMFLTRKAWGENPYVESTTKLSTIEFEDYLENCRRWAAYPENLGIYIPLPNEVEIPA